MRGSTDRVVQPSHCNLFVEFQVNFALREHSLRAENIVPVAIRMKEWESLASKKRIPFLMQKIKGALIEDQVFHRHRVEGSL